MARPLPLLMEDGRETTAMVDEISPGAAFSMTAVQPATGAACRREPVPRRLQATNRAVRLRGPQLKGLQNEALIDDLSLVYVLLLVSACSRVRSDQGDRHRGKGCPAHSFHRQSRDELQREHSPGK